MVMIRKLISAWMLALVGSLLLPVVGIAAAVSGTTYDTPYTTTTAPVTAAEHTSVVETVCDGKISFQSMASSQARSLLGLSQISVAPKNVKTLTQQADDLVPLNNGKHRVTLRSPSQKMEVDLAGKSHGGVPTPHTKVSPRNPRAPKQPAYNTKNAPVVEATQQDIRTVRRYLERQNR